MWPISDTWNAPTTPQNDLKPRSPCHHIHSLSSLFFTAKLSTRQGSQSAINKEKKRLRERDRRGGMRQKKGEACEWGCCLAEGKAKHGEQEGEGTHFFKVFIFFPSKRCCRGIPVPFPLLIIPIIMAHYENLINNTEDIVVAISHMVVGLCSVTILPLASTYVCQRRAAMTSSSCAHLALPTERHTLGVGGGGYSSWLPAWVNFVCGIRSDWGQNVNWHPGWPIKLWCSWEREGRGAEQREETQKIIILACVLLQH